MPYRTALTYLLLWDRRGRGGGQLASGVCQYRLRARSQERARKLPLLH